MTVLAVPNGVTVSGEPCITLLVSLPLSARDIDTFTKWYCTKRTTLLRAREASSSFLDCARQYLQVAISCRRLQESRESFSRFALLLNRLQKRSYEPSNSTLKKLHCSQNSEHVALVLVRVCVRVLALTVLTCCSIQGHMEGLPVQWVLHISSVALSVGHCQVRAADKIAGTRPDIYLLIQACL